MIFSALVIHSSRKLELFIAAALFAYVCKELFSGMCAGFIVVPFE